VDFEEIKRSGKTLMGGIVKSVWKLEETRKGLGNFYPWRS